MARQGKSFLVVGLGRFGAGLAASLTRQGHEVVGVDLDLDTIEAVKDSVLDVICLDACNMRALAEVGVPQFDVCVVGRGEDLGQSLTIVMNLRELGAKRVVAKASTEQHAAILELIGVHHHDVVFPERDMSERMAHVLGSSLVSDFVALAADLALVEVEAPPAYTGSSLIDLDLRRRHGITVVGIRRSDEFVGNPRAEDLVHLGDRLLIIGPEERIEAFLAR